MGDIFYNLKNNALILIHKHDSLYQDRWQDGVLLYTGMGKKGYQDINFQQNKTLAQSRVNGVTVLLFSSTARDEYVFEGEVVLAAKPFTKYKVMKQTKKEKW